MANAAKAFDENNRPHNIHSLNPLRAPYSKRNEYEPWIKVRHGEMPPMMFQVKFADGSARSFPYSDLREVRYRDAGYVQFFLHSMQRIAITIEGRHLVELASLAGMAMIRSMSEIDPRIVDRSEDEAEIVSIEITPFANEKEA